MLDAASKIWSYKKKYGKKSRKIEDAFVFKVAEIIADYPEITSLRDVHINAKSAVVGKIASELHQAVEKVQSKVRYLWTKKPSLLKTYVHDLLGQKGKLFEPKSEPKSEPIEYMSTGICLKEEDLDTRDGTDPLSDYIHIQNNSVRDDDSTRNIDIFENNDILLQGNIVSSEETNQQFPDSTTDQVTGIVMSTQEQKETSARNERVVQMLVQPPLTDVEGFFMIIRPRLQQLESSDRSEAFLKLLKTMSKFESSKSRKKQKNNCDQGEQIIP